MDIHLISFKTCPFVQRAVITLKYKNIDFDITYIDLADPPKVVRGTAMSFFVAGILSMAFMGFAGLFHG